MHDRIMISQILNNILLYSFIFFNLNSKLPISLLLILLSIFRVVATLPISLKTSFNVLGSSDIIFDFEPRYLLTTFLTSAKLTAQTSQCACVTIKSGSKFFSFSALTL